MERRRTKRRRALVGSLWKRSLVVFNLRFADQHHRDVVAYWIYSAALAAFEPLPVGSDGDRRLTQRAYKDFQEFWIYRHNAEMVAQGIGEIPGLPGNFPNPLC